MWSCLDAIFASSLLTALSFSTAAVLVSILTILWIKASSKSPPGPWSLPVVGNIFLFGSLPHENVLKLAKHYGDVLSMKLGAKDVVILNSVDTVKEALVKNGSDFSGRPPLRSFVFCSNDAKTVAFTDFGPRYIKNRKATDIALRTVLDDSENFSNNVQEEAELLVKSLSNTENAKSFDPAPLLKYACCRIMFGLIFGKKLKNAFAKEVHQLMECSTAFIEGSAVGNTVDFMPWLEKLFKRQVKKVDDAVGQLLKFVYKIHELLKNSKPNENFSETTFITAIEKVTTKDENSKTHFTEERVINITSDCFGGGFEKLSTNLRWALGYLSTDTSLQKELKKEIETVKGKEPLTLKDRPNMPLLEATVLEALRLSCSLPFALPHCTTKDTTVGGYKLKKGTCVFVNLWACCHDPNYFTKPNTFNPHRFLNEKGKLVRPNCLFAYSAGDRKCPAEHFSKAILFVLLGKILQNVDISWDKKSYSPYDGKFGLALRPRPYKITVETNS